MQLEDAVVEDQEILRFLPRVNELLKSDTPLHSLTKLRPPLGDLDTCRGEIMRLLNAQDTASAHHVSVRMCSELCNAEAWLTRSFTARMLDNHTALDEAHYCITRALSMEDSFEAHHQLMMLHLQSGEEDDARTAAGYIKWRLDKGTFKVDGELAHKVLQEISEILDN
ncbi:MAG: hypothetical protein GY696_15030 [Gammaproteobacteria bacterium]|nr:hypothetical protein [Gammaproteobacteria bacterium]